MVQNDKLAKIDGEALAQVTPLEQHLAAVRTRLQEAGLAPATVNGTLYAIKGVVRAAFNLGVLPADEYQRLRDVKPLRGGRLPQGRALTSGEIGALMEACAQDEGPASVDERCSCGYSRTEGDSTGYSGGVSCTRC